ncbi:MAG: RidA family protein [Acidobacteria bacterium]|nr:RidA family protein [Acidobacteriota bacterium]MBI3663168.1 RidA family protein [Acidobacteriota bacterium]
MGSVASSAAPEKRRVINLPNRTVQAPFSDGVLSGGTLYLAGRIGLDPKTNKPPEDAEQEARLVLDGMQAVLKEAGMTMDDLATVTVYCPDVSLFNKFNGVYRTYFKKEFPARAFVGSGPLLFGARFEVQAIAVKQ